MKTSTRVLFAGILLCISALLPAQVSANNWRPTQPVEFVVMADKGGGADKIAKLVAELIRQNRLITTEIKVRNLHSGSGGEALSYLEENAGNEHVLLFTLNSFFTVPLTQPDRKLDIQKFQPIARLGLDPFLLWVHSERRDIQSIDDFVIAADLEDWTMAGTGSNSEDELLTRFLNYYYRINMRYRAQSGGGKVARLLSKRVVNSSLNNPAEIAKYSSTGQVKPLAVFTKERLPQYANVPTFWELGLKFEYLMQRSVAGPPGMSDEAGRFYSEVFKRVFDLAKWQDYRKRNGLVGAFLSGEPLRQFWQEQTSVHKQMLETLSSFGNQTNNN